MTFKLTTVSTAILAALASSAALAQDNTELQTDESMTITGRGFDDYKVDHASGAMRADISLLDTPQSVAVIPEIILDEQLATTLGEALSNDASVSPGTKKWNREVFSLRGFELASGDGYLIDGHQQFAHYMLPIETLERVEILKGPSSMLYGASNPGGLVNMVRKRPTFEPMVNVGTDIDDNGSHRVHIDASGSLNESGSLRGRMVMVKQDTEEVRQYADGDNRERDRFLGYGIIEADISDWGLLSVHYERTQDKANIDSGAWLDSNGNVIGDKDLIRDMSWAYTDNNVQNVGFDFTAYLNHGWELSTGYNYQQFDRRRFDSSPNTTARTELDGSYSITPFDRLDEWVHHTFYADLKGNFEALGVEHNTVFGINGLLYEYAQQRQTGERQDIGSDGSGALPDINYKNGARSESDNTSVGFYMQDLVTLNDQWQVLLGLRYDKYYDEISGTDSEGNAIKVSDGNDSSAFSPKVGVIYHPAYNGTIYASYAESFSHQSNVLNDNDTITEFDPLESRQFEVGTKWELFDQSLLLTGAIFDIELSNVQFTEYVDEDTSITTQGGKQRHQGAEAGAQGRISDKFFVMASAMYIDAEYTKDDTYQGNTPANVPEWSGSAWTRYAFTPSTAVNLGLNYQGERYADESNLVKLDGYTRIDAGASHKIKSGDVTWDLRFNIENLLDKEYFVGSGGTQDSFGIIRDVHYGDERRLKLSVNATF